MNKIIKKVLFLLILCVFVLLIYKIVNIYAVFHSEMSANVSLEKGKWNIVINGEEISKGYETEFVIDNIETTENSFVMPEKMAPGLFGKFKIEINPENTNVSVRYDIILDEEGLGDTNLKISSMNEIASGFELINTAENTYTGIILLEEINNGENHVIEMEVEWVDDGSNDENDTNLGREKDNKLQIPIKLRAIQYIGEEIIPMTKEE